MEKNKAENPGLKGHLNQGFGFEKVWVIWVFGFDQTRVANPSLYLLLH